MVAGRENQRPIAAAVDAQTVRQIRAVSLRTGEYIRRNEVIADLAARQRLRNLSKGMQLPIQSLSALYRIAVSATGCPLFSNAHIRFMYAMSMPKCLYCG